MEETNVLFESATGGFSITCITSPCSILSQAASVSDLVVANVAKNYPLTVSSGYTVDVIYQPVLTIANMDSVVVGCSVTFNAATYTCSTGKVTILAAVYANDVITYTLSQLRFTITFTTTQQTFTIPSTISDYTFALTNNFEKYVVA